MLESIFRQKKGAQPTINEIKDLARELGLKQIQVYKWFYDNRRKVIEQSDFRLRGFSGNGQELTNFQIVSAIRVFRDSRDDDISELALDIELNVEESAQRVIDIPSPTGTRQIVLGQVVSSSSHRNLS